MNNSMLRKRICLNSLLLAATALLLPALLAQQSGAAEPLVYEVASIKPADPDARGVRIMLTPGGGFKADNVRLRQLIEFAYNVQPFQIEGGPKWMNQEAYNVEAKAPRSGMTEADMRQMTDEQRKKYEEEVRTRMQALLAERFQLAVRKETKEVPVYALVVAKNGPKLRESQVAGAEGKRMMRGRPGDLEVESVGLDGLANFLARSLERPVTDKTGLTGKYDFRLQWTPEQRGPGGMEGPVGAATPDPMGASIFTAVQEQLGLRLESQKGMAEIVVIERAEKPTEN